MGYYYWQYAAHPDSSFSFKRDGVVYAPDARSAYLRTEAKLSGVEDYEYDIGIHLVLPIDELVISHYGSVEDVTGTEVLSNDDIAAACRDAVTATTLRTMGAKQEQQDDVYPRRQQQVVDWPYGS